MDILHFLDCLANIIKNHRFASLTPRLEHLLKGVAYVNGIINEQGHYLGVIDQGG